MNLQLVGLSIVLTIDSLWASSQSCPTEAGHCGKGAVSPKEGISYLQSKVQTANDADTLSNVCKFQCDQLQQSASFKTGSISLEPPPCETFCVGDCPCLKSTAERCELRSCSCCDYCATTSVPSLIPTRRPTSTPTLPQFEEDEVKTPRPPSSPTTSPSVPPTSSDECLDDIVQLDMLTSKLVVNNLGGVGPDTSLPEEFRLHGVGNMNGRVLDLVVKVAPGASYRPNLRVRNNNGMNCANKNEGAFATGHDICTSGGKFAQINLGSGLRGPRLGEETQLRYEFHFADGMQEAATVPGFYITFFDIDQNRNKRLREKLYMRGFKEAMLESNAEVKVTEHSDGWTSYMSMQVGYGCDNPTDPLNLGMTCNNVDQRKRAVTFLFEKTSGFEVRFETVCSNGCLEGGLSDGRNFLFGFKSSLSDLCIRA